MSTDNYTSPDLDRKQDLQIDTSNYGLEFAVANDEKELEKTNPKLFAAISSLRDMKHGISLSIITKLDLTSSGIDVEKAKVKELQVTYECQVLSKHLVDSPIEVLDLMYNNVSDEGTEAIVEALLNEKSTVRSKKSLSSRITTLGLGKVSTPLFMKGFF